MIGAPVGFVNAAESKELLRTIDIPSISTEGTRGGTPVAVAAINECITLFIEGTGDEGPVTGFEYPEDWVAKCTSPENLRLAEQGLAVLTSSGLSSAAGSRPVQLPLLQQRQRSFPSRTDTDLVSITLPCGIPVDVPAHGHAGTGSSVKFAGDYPDDVTAGLEFRAEASRERREYHGHVR